MNLRTLFAIPIAVILIVTVSLAGMVAGQGWSGMARGRAAIEAVERMRLLLGVAVQIAGRAGGHQFRSRQAVSPGGTCAAAFRRRAGGRPIRALRLVVAELNFEAQGQGQ